MDDGSLAGSRRLEIDGLNGLEVKSTDSDSLHAGEAFNGERAHSRSDDVNGVDESEARPLTAGNGRSDSEAETIVLSGKEGSQQHKARKAIKLEDAEYGSDAEASDARTSDGSKSPSQITNASRRRTLKRKRGREEPKPEADENERDSSALSSTSSSPAPRAHSSKTSGSRSDRSPSSPPVDDDTRSSKLRKRKTSNDKRGSDKHRRTRDVSAEAANAQDRRETRSATHFDEPTLRSSSLSSRLKGRARSTQSNLPPTQNVSKRRKQAPLHVDRTRASEDFHPESDDDSSIQSQHRLQRSQYSEMNVLSPAKVSHKKNKDRSGRTLLARACLQSTEEAERWIRERPQDIDIADNAGNTPLQTASINGKHEVVALLLEAGCDMTCKNIDLDTPLIDAVENSHVEVVKVLLDAGVDSRQRNAKGQAPLELVNAEDDRAEEVRAALLQARRASETNRRQSEDHRVHNGRDGDTPSAHASGASPTERNRSPPPLQLGGRKRTARSQQTSDALLWVNAEPRRLREEAGKGHMDVVDHILKMRPEANTDAVVAAVKGGHADVLGLMLAIASLDADPDPTQSADLKPGQSTPMLAAIGRGNLDIVSMLLRQPGFDPARRIYRDMTYPEISEERKGEKWEEERRILQEALDDHRLNGGRRSNTSSPRRVRTKRPAPKQESPEPSSSPHEIRKVRRSNPSINEVSEPETSDTKRKATYQGTALRQRGQEGSSLSDRAAGRSGPVKSKSADTKTGYDDVTATARPDILKPRRKLMSGNDLRSDQEARRKAKGTEEATSASTSSKPKSRQSFSSHDRPRSKPEEAILSSNNAKKAASEEPPRPKEESGRKRLRVSVSPRASRSDLNDLAKKKKRQRVDSQGKSVDHDRHSPASSPTLTANVVTSPTSVTSPPQAAAPVAFMGGSSAPVATDHQMDGLPNTVMLSPPHSSSLTISNVSGEINVDGVDAFQFKDEDSADRVTLSEAKRDHESKTGQERQAPSDKEQVDHAARIKRQAEEAQLEAIRQNEEAERQAQVEREAEEARLAKARRDEEMHRRRVEDEKQRREEQERRRREREEKENMRRLRQQHEEEEQARMNALPNGLRRAAELGPERARDSREITKWLPLRTVTTQALEPECDGQVADEQWLANIQVAPLLANSDLELSQYTAFSRRPATSSHVGSLWRQLRNPMSQTPATPGSFLTFATAVDLDKASMPKFLRLKIFWIKLSDFMDIVPRHPHLTTIPLHTRAIMLHKHPFGKPSTPILAEEHERQRGSPTMNGHLTNDNW